MLTYNRSVPKASTLQLPKELLEQIYAEVEARVERKFSERISALEKRAERAERERDIWQKRYFREQETSRHLQGKLELAEEKIRQLEALVEKQHAQIENLQKQLHKQPETVQPSNKEPSECKPKRARGRQPGSQGHGRNQRDHLEPIDCTHDFSPENRVCPKCGLPYKNIGEKVSEQIHTEYKLVRFVHRRMKIRKSCKCPGVKLIKTAPGPDQLFKGSLFSIETWSHVIFDKYHLQRPGNRVLQWLASFGLDDLSLGTITNGLKRLHKNKVFKPLVDEIRSRVTASKHQQKDETGWKVFQEMEGKKGYAWWLWVTLGNDCCFFEIDPSRSKEVAKRTIGAHSIVLSSDRLSSYHNLGPNVINAWCWAHIRRALLALASFHGLASLSKSWVKKVDKLYHLNNKRLSAPNEQMFAVHDAALRKEVTEFERQAKRNAKRSGMHEESSKVFHSIAKHWTGLTVFVNLPGIPMDNNASERALRNAVVGRKNYYGSGSHWSAELTAELFTIFATLDKNGINCRLWLIEYLYAVARNRCKPPTNATAFLPWNTPPSEHLLS
jgi:transposase